MNYKQISKITIYSIIMGIFAIVGIIMFATDFPNWIKYGPSFLKDPEIFTDPVNQLLPLSVQAARAWSAFSLVICILMSILTGWEIKKMEKTDYKKYFVASLGIFTWLIIPYTFYIGIKNKLYAEFFSYISQNRVGALQISFASFKGGFSKNGLRDKLFWNTIFGYFVFLVSLVGFIFCFLIPEYIYGIEVIHPINSAMLKPGFTVEAYYQYLEVNSIFEIFSYFTQLTNMACFIFMLSFVLFSKKIPFRNNTIMIAMSSYIFVVCAIFWGYLFPQSLANGTYKKDFQWVKTSWLHAVTPILFIMFFITSLLVSKQAPTSLKGLIGTSIFYPMSYGIYVYSLPFYTRFSVYGGLTNLNPNMSTSVGIAQEPKFGSPLMLLGLFGLVALFIFVFFCFWYVAFLINKKEDKKMQVA